MKKRFTESKLRIFLYIGMILLFCSSFTGCKKEEQKSDESEYKVYYLDSEEARVVGEPYEPEGNDTTELLEEFLLQLDLNPKNLSYKKAKPDNVTIKDYKLTDDGQLSLNFDVNYKSLTGISEILCRAAIVKTLGQIDGIEYIEFNVNGQPLMNTNEKPIGFMKRDDFIENTGGETDYTQEVTMTLFFANKKGNALVETRVTKIYDGTISMEQLIIEQLIKGPSVIKGTKEGTLYPTIPSSVSLIKVSTKDGVCYVDLSKEFLEKIPEITDQVAIYSVVNSLVEMPSVNKVKFLIEGEEHKTYRETMTFNEFFERNLDIVKE
ncbi:germination protein M [Mobilisporobacter senegalensis]|uniref:Germination protein M n=1 Tax=Mobilisporobacter senegalensis TaxID=1329262 RepID=A0A3N1XVD4_9FIRM|nr:GerMN domain-containing protein [Mobilisporobacter senegalensis]ROR30579.1 germination protein M [Mobilisporobacter senegalensis]